MIEQSKNMEVSQSVTVKSGSWAPVIDLRHCKACGKCVEVCPNGVIEIRNINLTDYERLGWFARMKIRHHDMQIACVIHSDDCQSCGQCLKACREHAIRKKSPISDRA
jgi:4Fe-4S ferredoxin